MLHPSERDLSQPIDYEPTLWAETGGPPNWHSEAGAYGIKLAPDSNQWVQTQAIMSFNPYPGRQLLIAARIRIEDLDGCDFRFGLWETGDIFFQEPQRGVLFRRDANGNGPRLYGQARNGTFTDTDEDFAPISGGAFFDLAIVIRRITPEAPGIADFLCSRPDGSWEAHSVGSNIPAYRHDLYPLRPSFAFRRGQTGQFYVWSLVMDELNIRE